MRMVSFHCPVAFNDGSPVPVQRIRKLERLILEHAGGLSRSKVQGVWKHEGRIYREPVLRYMVGLEDDAVDLFVKVIERYIKREMQQISVWFEVDGKPMIL